MILFAEQVSNRKKDLLWLVRGEEMGMKCWFYVVIDQLKLPIFKKQLGSESMNLLKLGQIIESGWGENPPEEIVHYYSLK